MSSSLPCLRACFLSGVVGIVVAASLPSAAASDDLLSETRTDGGDSVVAVDEGGGATTFGVPRMTVALGSLALAASSPSDRTRAAPDGSSPEASSTPRQKRGTTFSATFNFSGYPWSEFEIGDLDEEWDDAWKYEVTFCGHTGLSGHVEPYAGAYFYFDDREWKGGTSSVDNRVFGLGLELGAHLYALEKADTRAINIPVVPFLRIGMGFNDGKYENVPKGDDLFISGDIDSLRFEIAGGVDVRMIIGRRVMVGIGAGVCYWNSLDVNGVTRNGVGVIVISDDEADFEGLDAFARLTVGILF